ncbi:MAG: hypothetical protein ACYSUA_03720 [Planctomycetota bacterium]
MAATRLIRRSALPAAAFIVVLGFHFAWIGLFPEDNPAQNRWVSIGPAAQPSWLARYIEGQHYWMGYVYALSLGFAVIAVRRYVEDRSCRARNFAVGGVTFSGFMLPRRLLRLADAGCLPQPVRRRVSAVRQAARGGHLHATHSRLILVDAAHEPAGT